MNEEEIEQLARENFSRRIRAIAMESLLLEKTKVEKKKTKKEGKEDDDWKSLRNFKGFLCLFVGLLVVLMISWFSMLTGGEGVQP